ncbi:LytTR family DNA-binding domain-containing protein [Sphingobacterium sp.]|uniref:LytR/AlgR family response regulator transcription factor n=1 Tax=Sphingobacterium sp. TaxID=341027 RepID=UPI0028AA7DDA|nr:LytTR family DNA-binding domain-containing protein [Sphingobacterium sp.]
MLLSCIIIDDEYHAQMELSEALHKTPVVSLQGIFDDISAAYHFLEKNGKVDLIFCDINMPDLNGIDAASILKLKCTSLIYVTAHREYALDAFNVNADGYLLKPITQHALNEKIAYYLEKNNKYEQGSKAENFVFVKGSAKNSFVKLNLHHVVYIEAMLNYVKIWVNNVYHITYLTLKAMEKNLNSFGTFIRVSKSIIINTEHIAEVEGNLIRMSDGTRLTIGDTFKNAFIQFMNKRTLN